MIIEVPDLSGAECGDIAITAAEGGINYWATIDTYRWRDWADEEDLPEDLCLVAISWDDPEDPKRRRHAAITPERIRDGLECGLRARLPSLTALLVVPREDWTGEIDADAADAIIQYSLFGELIYG